MRKVGKAMFFIGILFVFGTSGALENSSDTILFPWVLKEMFWILIMSVGWAMMEGENNG